MTESNRIFPKKSPKFKIYLLTILLLLAIGTVARFWNFSKPPFSPDESLLMTRAVSISRGIVDLLTTSNSQVSFKNIILPILQHNHAPLEFLSLIPAAPFENREFFGRLIFVVISTLTMLFGFLWYKLLEGEKASLIFLILLSTSAYSIWMGQTAMAMGLALSLGVFLSLGIINYFYKPKSANGLIAASILALGLLTFQDFIFYVPAFAWVVYDKSKSLKLIVKYLLTAFLLSGIFYIPYIAYGLFFETRNIGFNYVLHEKLTGHVDVFKNLSGYFNNFFLASGVLTVWPLSAIYFFKNKKTGYAKYFYLTIALYLIVFVTRSTTPFFYFISIWGAFAILSSKFLSTVKPQWSTPIIIVILIINSFGLNNIFTGINNPYIFGREEEKSDIKIVGKIVKNCVTSEQETYLSTQNSWQTAYYFGRNSLYEADGDENRLKLITDFSQTKIESVKAVHVRYEKIDEKTLEKLKQNAQEVHYFPHELLILYKNCQGQEINNI